jgi:hypothetical protein
MGKFKYAMQFARSKNPKIREAARSILSNTGLIRDRDLHAKLVLPLMMEDLNGNSEVEFRRGAQFISNFWSTLSKDPKTRNLVFKKLRESTQSGNMEAIRHAFWAISNIGDRYFQDLVVKEIKEPRNSGAQQFAFSALSKIVFKKGVSAKEVELLPQLYNYIRSRNEGWHKSSFELAVKIAKISDKNLPKDIVDTLVAAATTNSNAEYWETLCELGHPAAIPMLEAQFQIENKYTKRKAASGLLTFAIRNPSALIGSSKTFIALIDGEQSTTNDQILRAIAQIRDAEAIPKLIPLLESKSELIRLRSMQAIYFAATSSAQGEMLASAHIEKFAAFANSKLKNHAAVPVKAMAKALVTRLESSLLGKIISVASYLNRNLYGKK